MPYFGVELEFYLAPNINHEQLSALIGYNVKREKGHYQFEIDLAPSKDLAHYAELISKTRQLILHGANKLGGQANFDPKPFEDDYGNSMHLHIDFKPVGRVSDIAKKEFLNRVAASLCYFMLDSMIIFLPNEDDYKRLDKRFMAPTHVCYGGNNRTVAIRMPASIPLRLEHRVPSSNADPYMVMIAILNAIAKGLENPSIISNFPKIYGNAFDEQYGLIELPKSQNEAIKLFNPQILSFN